MKIRLLTTAAIFLIVFAACKNNKLKVNEEEAKSKLLEQEAIIAEQKRIEEEKAKAFADSIAKLPKALQIKANRSIDKKRPPVVFDIEKARAVVKPIKYSQLGKKVSYIKLSHQFDKDFLQRATVLLTANNIIIKSLGGLVCFNSDGILKEIVAKDGVLYRRKGNLWFNTYDDYKKYKGTLGMPFAIGDKLYYRYVDNANKQGWLMEYDMQQPAQINYNPEKEQQEIKPKGIRKTNMPSKGFNSFPQIIALDKYHWITNIRKWQSSKEGNFLIVQNFTGDTVCQLKDFDPIKNFTSSNFRIVEENTDAYRLNGHLHFRQNLNDTIYRFEAVNRTVPLYVIDFGEKRVPSSLHAFHPKYSLKDKFVNYDLLETNNLVIVFYTQDYTCKNTAKKGTLLFNCFVYDKKTGEQYHTYINELPYNYNSKSNEYPKPPHKGIINDLDYGITTWGWERTEDGRFYQLLNGKQIKEHIKNNPKNSKLANKELLEEIANKAKDDDLFIMTISN